MNSADFYYADPKFVTFIFLIFPILSLFWALFVYRKKALERFSSKENLAKLLIARSNNLYKVIAFSLVWILIVLALMQPKGDGYYPDSLKNQAETTKLKAHDLIFMVDASASMAIQDDPLGKTRLDLAKEIADEIMSDLKGESASLYAFTSTATKISPQTLDLFFVRMMLRGISINEGGLAGTDFLASLQKIKEKHFKTSTTKLTTLIILSDGQDTELETLTGESQTLRLNQIVNLIDDPKKLNLRVFTIGIGKATEQIIPEVQYQGKPVYSKLTVKLLKQLSEKAEGSYFDTNQLSPLEISKQLFEKLSQDNAFLKTEKKDPKESLIYRQYFQIPLAIALILLSFYILFPNISILSLFFCCFMIPLSANEVDLKKAENYVQASDYAQAQNIYQNMLKDKNLPNFEKAIVKYNQATLYLFQNELKEAIELYESIPLKGSPPPFLKRRIFTNLALAKLNSSLKESTDDKNDLEKKVYLLKSAQDVLKKAKKAECENQALKGRAECLKPNDLIELEMLIENELKSLSKLVNVDELYNSSLKNINGESLETLRKKIDTLESEALNSKPKDLKELNALLLKAIEAEQQALMITRVLSRVEDPSTNAMELLNLTQQKTINIADHYLESLNNLTQQSFEIFGKCQKKPWNEIVPLYNKGYEAAIIALSLIFDHLEQASLKQEETIKFWKEILKVSNKDQSENETDKSEENKTDVDRAKSNQEKSERALQLLQEMQMSDKQQNNVPVQFKNQVDKPW